VLWSVVKFLVTRCLTLLANEWIVWGGLLLLLLISLLLLSHSFMFFWFHFLSLYIWLYVLCVFVWFCKLCVFVVMFVYSHCYVCSYSVYSVFIVPTGTLRLPWLRVFRAFSSVVRQMPGYNSQRRGTAHTLSN